MNLRKNLLLAVAAFVLGVGIATSAQTADTFDWNAFQWARDQAEVPIGMALDGFGTIRDLAKLALSAPSESAERAHLEYIVTILEGSSGPDVTVVKLPIEAVYSESQLSGRYPIFMYTRLFELVGGTQRGWEMLEEGQELFVAEGGAAGTAAAASPLVSRLADFVRENRTPLVAYYGATYGTDGKIILTAHLSSIESTQRDIDVLARHALTAALDALNSPDPQTRRERLLDLYAASVAISGLNLTVETLDQEDVRKVRSPDWYGWVDPDSLGGSLLRAISQLDSDMTDALAATVTP